MSSKTVIDMIKQFEPMTLSLRSLWTGVTYKGEPSRLSNEELTETVGAYQWYEDTKHLILHI